MDTPINWHMMEAGELLDMHIVRKLGYVFERVPTEEDDERGRWMWRCLNPKGNRIGWRIDDALEPPPLEKWFWFNRSGIPHYSTDLNEAWTLLPITRHIRMARLTDRGGDSVGLPNETSAEIWNCDVTPSAIEAVGIADTPALAICRAFLKWQRTTTVDSE